MPDDLYDRDILIWSKHQAGLLRRIAAGERINAAVDWPNLIEEVEDLGRAELHACESLLRQAMLHLIKLHAGADLPAPYWRAETLGFLADASARFTPSMRQRIDLDVIFSRACQQAKAALYPDNLPTLPERCPWTLDGLMNGAVDLDALLASL